MMTLGSASTADLLSRTQSSPTALVDGGGGSTRQSAVRRFSGTFSISASSNWRRKTTYLKGTSGFRCTRVSSAASALVALAYNTGTPREVQRPPARRASPSDRRSWRRPPRRKPTRRVFPSRCAKLRASGVNSMLNATKQVLDLARAYLRVRIVQRYRATQAKLRRGQPLAGVIVGLQDFDGLAHQPGKAHHPVGLSRAEPAACFPAMERGLGDAKSWRELLHWHLQAGL